MNKKLQTFLTNLALLGMIAELSYINSKSLMQLAGNQAQVHQVFAIVGAIAFSIVTIIVMQQGHLKWQKVAFPVFDAALVFLGFNLDWHPDMRIFLTVFMAVFAGLIMYSRGIIEYRFGESKGEPGNHYGKELESLKSELKLRNSKFEEMQRYYEEIESNYNLLKSNLEVAQSKIEVMEPIYRKHELGRIRKKNAENLTPEEKTLLAMSNIESCLR